MRLLGWFGFIRFLRGRHSGHWFGSGLGIVGFVVAGFVLVRLVSSVCGIRVARFIPVRLGRLGAHWVSMGSFGFAPKGRLVRSGSFWCALLSLGASGSSRCDLRVAVFVLVRRLRRSAHGWSLGWFRLVWFICVPWGVDRFVLVRLVLLGGP